ncbi:MAG: 2-oxo acid dehydrogenase subunit E2 [Armatimonadetes bacterium]|nr:2-oxo acid dehydrogenase subunit E2 [Armatimonadota bacterium]
MQRTVAQPGPEPIPVTVPRLGWSMEEGIFQGWLKQPGEWVGAGDLLFVLEGDKAAQEVESLDEGVLQLPPDVPQPGDTVLVGQVLAYLVGKPGAAEPERTPGSGDAGSLARGIPASPAPGVDVTSGMGAPQSSRSGIPLLHSVPGEGGSGGREPSLTHPGDATGDGASGAARPAWPTHTSLRPRVISSPRARRAAEALGVDWTALRGTGPAGRVREADVRLAAGEREPVGETGPAADAGERMPVTPLRRALATRLTSGREVPAVTLTTRADASAITTFRAARRTAGEFVPGYTELLLQAAAAALAEHPLLNARWEGESILLSRSIHIAVAVDTPAGLVAPVIRDVPGQSSEELRRRLGDLAERARTGRLRPEELQGGTFTITNLGSLGVETFTPALNPPQCAILGIGAVAREPVVAEDQVVVRERLALSLTFDHRVVDGAPAARFLQTLRRRVESGGFG